MQRNYDILIVGAGMTGLALACALAKSKLRIAVLEQKQPEFTWDDSEYDTRVSAITRASQNILKNIGVWDEILQMRASHYRKMHVWDALGRGQIDFNCRDIGESELGFIVENRVIRKALWQKITKQSHCDLLCPIKLQQVIRDDNGVVLVTDEQEELHSQLIVAADGANSWLRQQLGMSIVEKDYGQQAIVATVKTRKSHQHTAWQRFLPTGPLAFLPLSDQHYSSIVWSNTPSNVNELMRLDEQAFAEKLALQFEHRLGAIESLSKPAAFPLRMRHARCYVQPSVALIGDAAHTIHPLAGQGANLGFLDSACLAEVILQANQVGRDIGSLSVLRKYERWRKSHNSAMITAMNGFKRFFSNEITPLVQLRNLGLTITNNISPLKNCLIKYAMGLHGDLPPLAKKYDQNIKAE